LLGVLVLAVPEILLGLGDLVVGIAVVTLRLLPRRGLGLTLSLARARRGLGLLRRSSPAAHAGECGSDEREGGEERQHMFPAHEDLEWMEISVGKTVARRHGARADGSLARGHRGTRKLIVRQARPVRTMSNHTRTGRP